MAPMRRVTVGGVLLVTLLLAGRPADSPAAPPKPHDAPKDVLDVQEWWGTYAITVTGEIQQSGVAQPNLPWSNSRWLRRRCEGSFHLNQSGAGGMMPGQTTADLGALMDKHRLRSWYTLPGPKDPPPTVRVTFDGGYQGMGTDPVEATAVDRKGSADVLHGSDSVRVYDQVMLCVDLKKKVYGLTIPYDTINTTAVKVATTQYVWTQRFDGVRTDKTAHTTKGGPSDKPNVPIPPRGKAGWIVDQPLPDGIAALKGSVGWDVTMGDGKKKYAHVEIKWFLSPEPPEDLELVLTPADERKYKVWRPLGSLSEQRPGSSIAVTATLQKRGGGTPKETAKGIRFTLEQVSHEPGICINYPLQSQCVDQPDLQFRLGDDGRAPGTHTIDDHTAVCTPQSSNEKLTKASAVVWSLDFGAFALVEATCELTSGREITAHLKGDEGHYDLRLPKSREGSHIADAWREQYDAQGEDASDDDNYPLGDGHKGDGFSLFEEYRGFVDKDNWSDMSPVVKDFFVVNRIGGDVEAGIQLFQAITNLHVHEVEERATYFRQVNFNRSPWASVTDQHGVILTQGVGREYSEAVNDSTIGGPEMGTPKDFDYVAMQDAGGSAPANTVAHELLHTCNVYHHGDGDVWHALWITEYDENRVISIYPAEWDSNPDGTPAKTAHPIPGGARIKLFTEDKPDREIDPPEWMQLAPGASVYIGMPHGQHSGVENCVMRYHVAAAYPKGPPNEYFWVAGTERKIPQNALCNGVQGYLVNRPGRKPMPRYGDADTSLKRGKCTEQILVNDAVPAPSRLGKGTK